jgi:hypothetical protein
VTGPPLAVERQELARGRVRVELAVDVHPADRRTLIVSGAIRSVVHVHDSLTYDALAR